MVGTLFLAFISLYKNEFGHHVDTIEMCEL
jgi:hypothetical protein